MIHEDPFPNIPNLPVARPGPRPPVVGSGAHPFVPDYALEDGGRAVPPSLGGEGAAISVVGSDGKLNLVPKHSTWSSPSAYPTELRAVDAGATFKANADGIASEGSGLDFLHDPVTGVGGWYVGSYKVEIDGSLVVRNVTLREYAVCDSGTPKTALFLSSAPYT